MWLFFVVSVLAGHAYGGHPLEKLLPSFTETAAASEPEDFHCFKEKINTGILCGMPRPGYGGAGVASAQRADLQYVIDMKPQGTTSLVMIAIDDQQWNKLEPIFQDLLKTRTKTASYVRELDGLSTIVKDFTSPSVHQMLSYAKGVDQLLKAGTRVVTHCAGGIGRTGVMLMSYFLWHFFWQNPTGSWEAIGLKAINHVKDNYREDAGEFDDTENMAALRDFFNKIKPQGVEFAKARDTWRAAGNHCTPAKKQDGCAALHFCTWCPGNKIASRCRYQPGPETCKDPMAPIGIPGTYPLSATVN